MAERTLGKWLLGGVAMASIATATPAVAQSAPRQEYDLASQSLGDALRALSRQSGKEIVFDASLVAGRRAPALKGSYTLDDALGVLLANTGLIARLDGNVIVIRGRAAASAPVTSGPTEDSEILVTGSRIRGAVVTSPVIMATGEQIRKSGMNDLGSFIRSLPQNFTGGQNPTVAGGGSQGNNENTTSSSALNLRGLGADATLTLLNGHRMPYDGVFQGIDIAAIPLSAVDRIEIVTDGASAIYGSDAVAGVANVMLRRSYQGLETSARVGGSTQGGNTQVQFGAVGGADWRSGGIMAVFDYSRQTAILAGDRDYTRSLDATQTLVPKLRQYGGIVTGRQALGNALEFSFDATYSHRESEIASPSTPSADYLTDGGLVVPVVESFTIAPELRLDPGRAWQLYLTGSYGESRAHLKTSFFAGGTAFFEAWSDYTNRVENAEAGASGSLAELPGGPLKLALGGGYRSNILDLSTRSRFGGVSQVTSDFSKGRDSWYGFAELSAPIIGEENRVALVHRLALTGALRYENYPKIGDVTTPKVGLLYSPVQGVDLKASWGRSFKAPTLYQQFQYKFVALRLASAYGANGFPAGATVLAMSGGNPAALEPEHAENLTLSAAFEPVALPGARLEASYFHIRYQDRIVQPIASSLGLFDNPLYVQFITLSPSAAQIAGALFDAPSGLSNQSGTAYDPAKVVAIIDNRQHNSARQEISGVDISLRYAFAAAGGTLTMLADSSYLRSSQILVAGQPETELAGTIFNAPRWRARGGLAWENDQFSLTGYLNYTGGTRDQRLLPEVAVRPMTTMDVAVTYQLRSDHKWLDQTTLSLSAINVLDADPGAVRKAFSVDTPYDSTNNTPVGRFVSLSVRKQW